MAEHATPLFHHSFITCFSFRRLTALVKSSHFLTQPLPRITAILEDLQHAPGVSIHSVLTVAAHWLIHHRPAAHIGKEHLIGGLEFKDPKAKPEKGVTEPELTESEAYAAFDDAVLRVMGAAGYPTVQVVAMG